ncbi:MAG TPA: tetratricopeptide repeat protein, partial [Candidatus Melainabacteria bacterium]|nr:tetratricopeptide repeat protein [Candidatus Melainabacteria bacterium]
MRQLVSGRPVTMKDFVQENAMKTGYSLFIALTIMLIAPAALEAKETKTEKCMVKAWQCFNRGEYRQADRNLQHSARMAKGKTEEREHLATSLANRATIISEQGNYKEADALFNEALAIYRDLHGEDHPYVTILMNNQAVLNYRAGKYQKAEALYQTVLQRSREQL